MKTRCNETFAKILQSQFVTNIAIYSQQATKLDRKKVEEELRIQQIFRSTLLAGRDHSVISEPSQSKKRKQNAFKTTHTKGKFHKKMKLQKPSKANTSSHSSSTSESSNPYTEPSVSSGEDSDDVSTDGDNNQPTIEEIPPTDDENPATDGEKISTDKDTENEKSDKDDAKKQTSSHCEI